MTRAPVIVLQARTSSRRLPGKALLHFQGLPLAILVARRAASQGARVILATSDLPSDDPLADLAARYDVACHRGSLDDVLGRFVEAIGDVPDAAPVVRLTGDNPVPDGDLIAQVVSAFEAQDLGYLTTGDAASGLPYGCAVEVMRAQSLRAADQAASTPAEREHVTPWIRARHGAAVFTDHAALARAHFRVTVDCLDDVFALNRAFEAAINAAQADAVSVPWQDVVTALRPGDGQPVTSRALRDMVLGTAQLGLPYGIARESSPTAQSSAEMVKLAITHGVAWLDTARAYGVSENRIGAVMAQGWDGRSRIVTKLAPLADCSAETPPETVRAHVAESLATSLQALKTDKLDTVLLHRASHAADWGGAALDTLLSWQSAGRIGAIGVSVQSPQELADVLARPVFTHIQMPCHILDHRWDESVSLLTAERARRTLTVHLRSTLLQGLLASDDHSLWARAHVEDPASVIAWLRSQAAAAGCTDVATLCLLWARGLDWADGVVVGCDSPEQLLRTMAAFDQPALTAPQMAALNADRPRLAARSLDPAQWQA